MTGSGRSDDYRYTVEVSGAEITPLASIEAFVGGRSLRILNVSQGGVALLFEQAPNVAEGDIIDVSITIRERGFPVQLEVRGIRALRASCSFVNPSRAFQGALREFLK